MRKVDAYGNPTPYKVVCNPNLSTVWVVKHVTVEAEETAEVG